MSATVSFWQKKHPWEPSPRSHPQPVPIVSQSDLANPMLRAIDLAAKGIRVCDPKLPVVEAVEMLAESESGLLPVVDSGKPVGLLTERGVVAAMARAKTDFYRLPVELVMSRRLPTVRDDATLNEIVGCFGTRGTLVIDRGGNLQGVIYWRSLADHFSERGLGRVLAGVIERERRATKKNEGAKRR